MLLSGIREKDRAASCMPAWSIPVPGEPLTSSADFNKVSRRSAVWNNCMPSVFKAGGGGSFREDLFC